MALDRPVLDHAAYTAIIAEQSARFREILEAGPLDAPVPGTPDWNLGDLGVHLVDVQRWATHIVTVGKPEERDVTSPAPAEAAVALTRSTEGLLAALAEVDPDDPGWNFSSGPQRKGFWFRRQALEVAVHRWDAESAVSDDPEPISPELAADVIDEFVHITLQRVIEREALDLSAVSGDVHVHCTDTPGEWTFEVVDGALVVSDEHRKSTVALRGPAGDLALFLYNRVPLDRIEMFGDESALRSWGAVFEF